MFIIIWLLLAIPFLSYLIFIKTFNLGMYGDDWLQLYLLWLEFDATHRLSYFSITSYLNPYWPQYLLLGIIRHFFDYQPTAYFAVSLAFRILANISIYFLTLGLTKSKLAAFLATVVFLFLAAGLQTTDWVFNMNTYLGIFFLNFSIYFYLKLRKAKSLNIKYFLFFVYFFALALGTVPVRMHGAVPILIFIDLFMTLLVEKRKIDRLFLIRVSTAALILIVLVKLGSFGDGVGQRGRVIEGFDHIKTMISQGRSDFWLYMVGIVGNIAIPDLNIKPSFQYPLVVSFFSTVLGLFIAFLVSKKRSSYFIILLFNILWLGLLRLISSHNPGLQGPHIFSILVGGQLIFLSLFIAFYSFKKYQLLSASLIVSLFWIFIFTFIYWFYAPYLLIDSTSRYLIMGAVAFAILAGSAVKILISEIKKFKTRLPLTAFTVLIFVSLLLINFRASQIYFSQLEKSRNSQLVERTWGTILNEVPTLEKDKQSVFYLTYDDSTSTYMVLTFGFWPHAGLLYGISNWKTTPVATESYEELLDYVKTGAPLQKVHTRPAEPVPLERVFAFDFRNGQLKNITPQIRQKIMKDLVFEGTR